MHDRLPSRRDNSLQHLRHEDSTEVAQGGWWWCTSLTMGSTRRQGLQLLHDPACTETACLGAALAMASVGRSKFHEIQPPNASRRNIVCSGPCCSLLWPTP